MLFDHNDRVGVVPPPSFSLRIESTIKDSAQVSIKGSANTLYFTLHPFNTAD